MPEYFSIAVLASILLRFPLEIWIVPKGAVTIKETRGQYWSFGILIVALVLIMIPTFTVDTYSQGYIPLFMLSVLMLFGAAQAWLEWYFAYEAKEYIVSTIITLFFIVSYFALELLF
ncbi:DUF4181 domain-containing protein [Marinococcus halophilus]|uniref:DUF4181 domain-containing protein n=1 Tax=Marinococcus halophilus TaxID=1371 RepID=A0A510Y4J5_MARHA|nr:DUF4181 domain-containing protein [Marinococcus halophilus]OZT80213.1 DUF4181 domain-containing protein [Marinococcus halophilus]GEK58268.1 hypothetical protein MHA01_11730 [Marinococcus halophilus]